MADGRATSRSAIHLDSDANEAPMDWLTRHHRKRGRPSRTNRAGLTRIQGRQPNKELLNLSPWKLSILSITHIQVKTTTISKSSTRNIALTRSKLKTYAMSSYYNIQQTCGQREINGDRT